MVHFRAFYSIGNIPNLIAEALKSKGSVNCETGKHLNGLRLSQQCDIDDRAEILLHTSQSPTSCTSQSSVSFGQRDQQTRDATSPLYLIPPTNPPELDRSPTVSSDLNLMSASPPELCSSPPIFEPPPLPHTLNAPPLLMASQPLVGRQPLSSGIHPSPMTTIAAVGATNHAGTVTGPVPSTFPSPGSAFTELHPRNGSISHPRGFPFPSVSGDGNSPRTVVQSKSSPGKTTAPPANTSSGGSSHSSSRSSAPSPIQYDALSSSVSSARSFTCAVVYCRICGQSHDPTTPHRYNYTQAVDADLCCSLCHQPLVEPLDTKCGHTFCTPCLKNHLAVQALCPVDRQIINYLECQQASNIVKRLLDKLLVSCPHTRFCDTVLYRASLEEHVRDWCPGTLVPCENAPHGCSYEGPRVTHTQHRWRCPFQTGLATLFQPINAIRSTVGPCCRDIPTSYHSGRALANSYPGTPNRFAPSMSRAAGSASTVPGATQCPTFFSPLPQPLSDRLRPSAFKPKLPEIEETYDCPTIYEGTPVSVVIRRSANCCDLGFTFVGGSDTPLSCILIQEIYLDGSVALDGRLRPGDQILEVNGQLVIEATHSEARRLLTYPTPLVQLTVYRETVEASARRNALSHTHEEVFHVKLCKRQGKVLGIKLVGKK
ncbi:unnamed protein product [Echinostoma caproni]|uniref:Ligand of Numb protein X 2 n=1 Tax=Echinostoma caproni TaxID=27848 RepID=A0A183AJJ1_9TREM|nr:unnamed protein product [Echinostoma caproni]